MKKYADETAGIYLRPITYEDTENIVRWRNSDAVRKYFIQQMLFTKESHENWLRTMVETGKVVQMIICDLATDTPYGSVYIRDIDRQHNKGEFGIFVGEESARHRGIGTAAARLMVQYGFEEEKLRRVYLRVLASNERAIRAYEKAGFEKEGLLRDDAYINGVYKDIVWMSVVNR